MISFCRVGTIGTLSSQTGEEADESSYDSHFDLRVGLSDLIYVFQNREKEKGGGGGEKEAEKGEKEKELCWPKLSVGGDESAVS